MDEVARRVAALRTLTPRELEVLTLLCEKLTQREIRDRLVLSMSVIKFHCGNIYDKLEVAQLQTGPRQREVGRFCEALRLLNADTSADPSPADPPQTRALERRPPKPSDWALAAVEEDDKAQEQKRREAERGRQALVPSTPTAPQTWRPPPPIPPGAGRVHPLVILMPSALIVVLLVAILIAVIAGREEGSPAVAQQIVTVTVTVPVQPPETATRIPATPVHTATPVVRTPTPLPTPTVQPVPGPTFLLTTQPVGCHDAAAASAVIVMSLPLGTVVSADQFIRLTDGTWHHTDRACWVRTQPGPVEVYPDEAKARSAAMRYAPPGTVLFHADASTGFADWPGARGWKVVGGMYINDGSDGDLSNWRKIWIQAPYSIPEGITDYAVEAEILMPGKPGCVSFGLVIRDAYQAGYHSCYFARMNVMTKDGNLINSTGFSPGDTWHTYRLEAQGFTIRMLVDGAVTNEVIDSKYIQTGRAGLWSDRTQLQVRRFRVIKLAPP